MAFREISAWISLGSFVVVYGSYFWSIVKHALAGQTENPVFGGRLIGTVVTLIVVQVILHIIAASLSPKDADAAMDERDRLIELKATNVAYYFVVAGTFAAFVLIGMDKPVFVTANALILYLVLAEIARATWTIFYYRRGL